jgi:hypothetical protein
MILVVSASLTAAIGLGPSAVTPASAFGLMANWIELAPTTSPPPRTAAAMAYDPATGTTVLFGGEEVTSSGNGVMLSDTWSLAGSTWTQQSPASSPPARYGASMAYDAATGDIVLFGGLSGSGDMADTWTWDGSTWTEQVPKTSPPARSTASMTYDAETETVVLFGGLANRALLSDTWTWNGVTWTQQSSGTKPSARDAAVMSYDPATQRTVLFGGNGGTTNLADTWTWNGSSWASADPTVSPSGRFGSSMTYDPATSKLVLFGGYDGGQSDLSDMWTFDGTTWTEQYPATSPPARRYATMDYDATAGSVVLFGGDPGGTTPGSLGDTWIWGSEGTFSDSPQSPTILLGSSETDAVAVTGNAGAEVPTGTVTFYTCGPSAPGAPCTSQPEPLGDPENLTPGAGDSATATSPPFVPTAAGDWCFVADYSGDNEYAPVDDGTDGCFVVNPPIATTPALSTLILGGTDTDGATVFGTTTGGSPTGTVAFYACGPTAVPTPCASQTDPVGGPVTLTPGTGDTATATSPAFSPPLVGVWCFAGYYSGGGTYPSASDATTDECFSVTPDFATAPTEPSIALGASDTDASAVTGNAVGGVPTGTVTFYACGPTATPVPCTSTADPVGNPVQLTPGPDDTATAVSPAFTATALGDWCFGGYYSGGGPYQASADNAIGECFDVVAVGPTFTSVDSATGTAKQAFTFSITTTGAPAPVITASRLPKWLVLTDNNDGTATLHATKAARGKHRVLLTATNGAGAITQTFTLTVRKPAAG